MTQRKRRFYVVSLSSCFLCPALVRIGTTSRCSKVGHLRPPIRDEDSREIPDVMRIPRWCPLPKEKP